MLEKIETIIRYFNERGKPDASHKAQEYAVSVAFGEQDVEITFKGKRNARSVDYQQFLAFCNYLTSNYGHEQNAWQPKMFATKFTFSEKAPLGDGKQYLLDILNYHSTGIPVERDFKHVDRLGKMERTIER